MKDIIQLHKSDGYFWFRIFGIGLHFKNTGKHPLSYRERNGITKRIQIGNISIKALW